MRKNRSNLLMFSQYIVFHRNSIGNDQEFYHENIYSHIFPNYRAKNPLKECRFN